jgi:GNAT superfamily N-acetyltransferase
VTGDHFIIRSAVPADASQLTLLIGQLGYESTLADVEERLHRLRSHPDYEVLVLEDRGRIIGLASVQVGLAIEKNGCWGRLLALSVDESERRRGAGRALVEACETWARDRGATSMVITSGHHRAWAHQFYERCGYAATGLRFFRELQ